MAATKTFYTFGVKKLEIAPYPTAGATSPVWVQVPSIEEATLKASVSDVKGYGDDVLQYTFVHSPEQQLNVKLSKFSGRIAEMLTGNTASTVSGRERLLMMTDKDLASPYLISRVTIPSKDDATGLSVDLLLVFYKVQFRPIWDGFGSARGKALELNWVADLLSSTQDERGDPVVGVANAVGHYLF
jgi:hypothetical protein